MLFFLQKRPRLENLVQILLLSLGFSYYLLPPVVICRFVLLFLALGQFIYVVTSLNHLQKLSFKLFQLLFLVGSGVNHKAGLRTDLGLLQFLDLQNSLMLLGSIDRFVLKRCMKRM